MELTRKQVINVLNTLKLEWGELAPPEDNICDALDYAIDDMKKLEKIEQIVNDRYGKPTFEFMNNGIIKVVKDGFNDSVIRDGLKENKDGNDD